MTIRHIDCPRLGRMAMPPTALRHTQGHQIRPCSILPRLMSRVHYQYVILFLETHNL